MRIAVDEKEKRQHTRQPKVGKHRGKSNHEKLHSRDLPSVGDDVGLRKDNQWRSASDRKACEKSSKTTNLVVEGLVESDGGEVEEPDAVLGVNDESTGL